MSGNDIVLSIGQSNELGHGLGPYITPSVAFDSRIFQIGRFKNQSGSIDHDMKIIPATDALEYWDINPATQTAHGHAMSFCRLYAATFLPPGRNVLIVPAAHGGSSVLEWLQIVTNDEGQHLYDDFGVRANLALAQPGFNRIVACLDFQSEQDVAYADNDRLPNHDLMPDAEVYRARKTELVDRIRADFGMFPWFLGLDCDAWLPGDPIKAAFAQMIRDVAASRALLAVCETAGVESNIAVDPLENPVHFSAAGQEVLAQRLIAGFTAMREAMLLQFGDSEN